MVAGSGRLVGIVRRADLLWPLTRPDEEIRWAIENLLEHELLVDPGRVEVGVRDGVVTLTGQIERRSLIPIVVRLAGATEGGRAGPGPVDLRPGRHRPSPLDHQPAAHLTPARREERCGGRLRGRRLPGVAQQSPDPAGGPAPVGELVGQQAHGRAAGCGGPEGDVH